MKQVFPFGRGGRGSQQRLFLEFGVHGGTMRQHTFTINLAQVGMPSFVVFRVGTSEFQGKRDFFVHCRVATLLKSSVRAAKMFRVTRQVNKMHKRLRAGKSIDAQRTKIQQLTKAREYAKNYN